MENVFNMLIFLNSFSFMALFRSVISDCTFINFPCSHKNMGEFFGLLSVFFFFILYLIVPSKTNPLMVNVWFRQIFLLTPWRLLGFNESDVNISDKSMEPNLDLKLEVVQ